MPFEDALAELDALITERSGASPAAVPSTPAPPGPVSLPSPELNRLDELLGLAQRNPKEFKRAQLQHQFETVGAEDTAETVLARMNLERGNIRAGLARAGAGLIRGTVPFGLANRAADELAAYGTEQAQDVAPYIEKVGGGPVTSAAGFLTSVAGQSLPPLLAGPAGLPAMAIAAGAQSFGGVEQEAYERYRAQGDTETQAYLKSLPPAVASGAITGLLTRYMGGGTERAVQKIFNAFSQGEARQTIMSALREAVASIPKEAIAEFPEEALDQLAQGFIAQHTYAPERTTPEILRESLLAGLAGLALGGGVATARVPLAVAGPAIEGSRRAERLEQLRAERASPERQAYLERLGLVETIMAAGKESDRYANEIRNEQENLRRERARLLEGQNIPEDSGQVRSEEGALPGGGGVVLDAAQVQEQNAPVEVLEEATGAPIELPIRTEAGLRLASVRGRYLDGGGVAIDHIRIRDPQTGAYDRIYAPEGRVFPTWREAQAAGLALLRERFPESGALPAPAPQAPPVGTFTPVPPGQRGRGMPVGQIRARLAVPPGERGRGVPVAPPATPVAVPVGERGRGVPAAPAPPLAIPPGRRGRGLPQAPPGSAFTGTTPPSQRGRQKLYMQRAAGVALPSYFWLGPRGEIIPVTSSMGHIGNALDILRVKLGPSVDQMGNQSIYQEMFNQGYVRGVYIDGDVHLNGNLSSGSNLNKAQRRVMEGVSFDRAAAVSFNDRTVFEKPSHIGVKLPAQSRIPVLYPGRPDWLSDFDTTNLTTILSSTATWLTSQTKAKPELVKAFSYLANRFAGKVRAKIVLSERTDMTNPNAPGVYDPATETITIFLPVIADSSEFANSILHETTHALTSSILTRWMIQTNNITGLTPEIIKAYATALPLTEIETKAAEGLANDFLQVLEVLKANNWERADYYGASNLHEFAAEIISNPDFQDMTAAMKGSSGTKSLWQEIVDAFKKFLAAMFGSSEEFIGESVFISALNNVLTIAEHYKPGSDIEVTRLGNQFTDTPEIGEMLPTVQSSLGTLREALSGGDPRLIEEARENVRREEAGEVFGQQERIRQSTRTLLDIYGQRNVAGDVRLTGEALQRMKVIEGLVNDRWVRKHMINPTLDMEDAAAQMEEAFHNFTGLSRDPQASHEVRSAAALVAAKKLDSFMASVQAMESNYDGNRQRMLNELDQLNEARAEVDPAKEAMDNLMEEFREIGREIVKMERSTAAATTYKRAFTDQVALRNAMNFITRHVDLTGVENGTITTIDQLRDHIVNTAAAMITNDQTVDQIIGTTPDKVRLVAQYILRSQPLRQRIAESRSWIMAGAQRLPLSKFKTALAKEIRAGHIGAALRLFVDGVGASAVERAKTAELARFFKRKEQKALIDLQVLDEKMELARGLTRDPGLRATSQQVHDALQVRQVQVTPDGQNYVLTGVGTDAEGHPKPDVTIALSSEGLANEKNIKAGQEWIKDAQAYMADTESPDYDPRRAAGLQAAINLLQPLVDNSINPTAPRFMEGAPRKIYRKIFDFLGQLDAVPEFILDHVAGTVGERANQSLTALDTIFEQSTALARKHGPKLEAALRDAINTHKTEGGAEMTLDQYREKVYGPIAASHQEFENLGRLKAGDSLHNGLTVTPQDMAYFELERAFEDAVIKVVTATAETEMQAIKNQPSGIFYKGADGKRYVRLPGHHGPGTVTRRFSLRATGPGGWIEAWRANRNPADRIALLDRHVDRLILGYLRGAGENTLRANYRWREALRSIYQSTESEPVTSFEDLIDRLMEYGFQDDNEQPLGREAVEAQVLSEFDELFKRWETFIKTRKESQTSVAQIYGGRSPFHVERGEQVVPSLWYDYGTVGAGDRMSYLRDAAVYFVAEHINSIEKLRTSLDNLHIKVKEEGGPRQKRTRTQQLEGKEYYNWNQLNHLRHRVSGYLNSLNQMITRMNQVSEGGQVMDITGANPVTDLVAGSLLFAVAPQILNATGGAWMTSVVHKMLTNQSIFTSMAKVSRGAAKVIAKDFISMLASEKSPHGEAVREFLESHGGAGITGKMAETLVEWIDSSRELWRHSAQLGMNQNADLWRTIASQWQWSDRGGVSSQDRPETALGRAAGRVRTAGRSLGTILTGGSVGAVDSRINAIAVELARELEQDLMNKALEYGGLREERARQGGWDPGDMTDMRNRFSPEELRGGFSDQSREAAATRLRQLFVRRVGVNLDEAMYSFYRRVKDSGVNLDSPDFEIPEGMRLLNDAQLNQLTLALSEATNQASFSTRPISPRTNKFIQLLSLFHGYPAMAVYRLTSSVDQLANRKWSKQSLGRLAMGAGAALSAAVVGALAIGGQDWSRRRMLNRVSPYPTVFDTNQEPWEYAKTVMGGAAALIPAYGGALNALIGRAYRTGFDINSSFVILNLATDVVKTFKKVAQTRGNLAELARPFVEFGTRWAFPMTWMGPRLPNVSGLMEQRATANLLARGARGTGLEERIRRSSTGGDVVYTPMSAKLDSFWNALGQQDPQAAGAIWQEMVRMRMAEGDTNPEASVARAVQSRHPLNRVFGEPLTRDEYAQVLSHLNPEDAERVQQYIGYADSVITGLGGTPLRFGGEAGGASAPRVAAAAAPRRITVPRLGGLRRAAVGGGVRIPSARTGVSVRAPVVRAPAPSRVRTRRLRAPRIPRPRAIAGRMRVRSRVGSLRRVAMPHVRRFY